MWHSEHVVLMSSFKFINKSIIVSSSSFRELRTKKNEQLVYVCVGMQERQLEKGIWVGVGERKGERGKVGEKERERESK